MDRVMRMFNSLTNDVDKVEKLAADELVDVKVVSAQGAKDVVTYPGPVYHM